MIGTGSATARKQVQRLLAARGVVDVPLPLDADDPVGKAAAAAAEALASARCAVVHTTALQLTGDDVRRRIPGTLAAVVGRLAGDGGVEGLVVSGGETAINVARALGGRGLLIEEELEAGVPVSRLIGPRPCRIVSKAGEFGGETTLVAAVEALGGRL